jgi:hypothetical protein
MKKASDQRNRNPVGISQFRKNFVKKTAVIADEETKERRQPGARRTRLLLSRQARRMGRQTALKHS